MTRLLPLVVLLGLVGALADCGGSAAPETRPPARPGHGILFTYRDCPTLPAFGKFCGDDIYVWHRGFAPRRITRSPLPRREPTWSPDGRVIAWSMVPAADCTDDQTCTDAFGCMDQVFVADSDGRHVRRVSRAYGDDSGPGCSLAPISWSADGKRLLFTREANDSPTNVAVLTLKTGAIERLRLPDFESGPIVWGKPGIAYIAYIHPHWIQALHYELRVVDPATTHYSFVVPLAPDRGTYGTYSLGWSSRGDLAVTDGHRLVIYSSTGRRLDEFTGPTRASAPAITSPVVWSPDGARLLVCIDPFGGLSGKAHQKLVNTRQKRDRYPAFIPYLVDRDGKHWKRFELPNPQKKESLCSTTSWR